jgi:hypothetical protein
VLTKAALETILRIPPFAKHQSAYGSIPIFYKLVAFLFFLRKNIKKNFISQNIILKKAFLCK